MGNDESLVISKIGSFQRLPTDVMLNEVQNNNER